MEVVDDVKCHIPRFIQIFGSEFSQNICVLRSPAGRIQGNDADKLRTLSYVTQGQDRVEEQ